MHAVQNLCPHSADAVSAATILSMQMAHSASASSFAADEGCWWCCWWCSGSGQCCGTDAGCGQQRGLLHIPHCSWSPTEFTYVQMLHAHPSSGELAPSCCSCVSSTARSPTKIGTTLGLGRRFQQVGPAGCVGAGDALSSPISSRGCYQYVL
jgi:hypothetical protein